METTKSHGRVNQGPVWFSTSPSKLRAEAEARRAETQRRQPQVVIRRRPDGTRTRITIERG